MRSVRILLAACLLAAGAALAAGGELPTVQSGKWILKSKVNGAPHQTTLCGNPLDKVAAAIAAARDMEQLGCRVVVRQPVPRATSVLVECPAERVSADGSRRVRKGRTELTENPVPDIPSPPKKLVIMEG